MLRIVLLALLPGLVAAQFRNLVTTDDGSLLLFSSTLQVPGTNQFSWDKLFSMDSSGVKLYEQRQEQGPAPGSRLSNFYLMEDAELSGDGSVRALIAGRVCLIAGSGCFQSNYFVQSEVSGVPGQETLTAPGVIRISRNGRYAFASAPMASPTLLDLNTGATKTVSGFATSPTRGMVSSTGTVVLARQQDSLMVVSFNDTREIQISAKGMRAVIDDNATSVIYEGQLPNGGALLAQVDLQTGIERPLVTASDAVLVGATSDGQSVTFLSDAKLTSAETAGLQQLFWVRADGSGLRQITQDPAGLVEATLARNGTVAYAVTAAGRLLKIDMASGSVTVLIGRTLTLQLPISSSPPTPVAGSAFCVNGTGLVDSASSAAPPLPASLGGFQLLLDQNPLPLQSVAPGQVCFQLPWDTALGPHTLTAVTSSDPTFQAISTTDLSIYYAAFPNFLSLGPQYSSSVSLAAYALAYHEDFRGYLTRADPARPGEIIHFRMTGLGPVDPPVPTGAAAPANPPSTVTQPIACQFAAGPPSAAVAAPVLFAGLAQGTAGYYQMSVQVPNNVPVLYGDALIHCTLGTLGEGAWIPVFAPRCSAPGLIGPGRTRRACLAAAQPVR